MSASGKSPKHNSPTTPQLPPPASDEPSSASSGRARARKSSGATPSTRSTNLGREATPQTKSSTIQDPADKKKPWYHQGLRFTCTECGKCCTGEPGYVWINDDEIAQCADLLKLSDKEFEARFVRFTKMGKSLKERSNGDCVLLADGVGCSVYQGRPSQCRTWPFWKSNLQRQADWRRTVKECPGAGQGRLYSLEEIEELADVVDI